VRENEQDVISAINRCKFLQNLLQFYRWRCKFLMPFMHALV
jgi:hypothetical protein